MSISPCSENIGRGMVAMFCRLNLEMAIHNSSLCSELMNHEVEAENGWFSF